ncbi:hypothetical protein BDW22DRAFT_864209 [Trametopsis cervina]|nr:hypothetical protein BDW22DRAFT_864209 [Trametopsis cervina]
MIQNASAVHNAPFAALRGLQVSSRVRLTSVRVSESSLRLLLPSDWELLRVWSTKAGEYCAQRNDCHRRCCLRLEPEHMASPAQYSIALMYLYLHLFTWSFRGSRQTPAETQYICMNIYLTAHIKTYVYLNSCHSQSGSAYDTLGRFQRTNLCPRLK